MKNYVKEYKGYKVPEGATHYDEANTLWPRCFIDAKYGRIDKMDGNGWVLSEKTMPTTAIELPKAQLEWNGEGLPPVGTLCTISTEDYEYLFSAASNELSSITENTVLVVVGHCTRHDNGAECVTLMARDSKDARGFTTVNPDFVSPLKTQQEKDREAFIGSVKQLLPKSDDDDLILAGKLFELGFTAPKATSNENL